MVGALAPFVAPERIAEVATLSSESIARPSPADTANAAAQCASCGAPMGADQRYCLECGERRLPMSGFLMGGGPVGGAPESARAATPPAPPVPPAAAAPRGGNALNVIAGVGVLMLAMGVGVLIGRSGATKPNAAPAQVITVGSVAGGTSAATSESFTSDWPAGTSGYTVQLQTLPLTGTTLAAVQAAKSAASAKGATGVGALKSDEFSSLTAGSYVIYAGIEAKQAAAQKELAGLKAKFPGASVIRVASGPAGSGGASTKPNGSSSGSGAGSSITHPAPASVLESLQTSKGKSYEEKSKNLPDVVETG
jgi:hypothetical protein